MHTRDTCTVELLLANCLLLCNVEAGSPCYRMLSALPALSLNLCNFKVIALRNNEWGCRLRWRRTLSA